MACGSRRWVALCSVLPKRPPIPWRLSHLIHSDKWGSGIMEWDLGQQACEQLTAWEAQGYQGIVDWDESRLEKQESSQLAGLRAVHASLAARRTRMRKGDYHPPTGRICVAGRRLSSCAAAGPLSHARRCGAGSDARAPAAGDRAPAAPRDEQAQLLVEQLARPGPTPDPYRRIKASPASGGWGCVWPSSSSSSYEGLGDYHLLDANAVARPAWKIAPSAKGPAPGAGWGRVDASASIQRAGLALPVRHPAFPAVALSMVVVRGQEHPW